MISLADVSQIRDEMNDQLPDSLSDQSTFEGFSGKPDIEVDVAGNITLNSPVANLDKFWRAPAGFASLVDHAVSSLVNAHDLEQMREVVLGLDGVIDNKELIGSLSKAVTDLDLGPAENPEDTLKLYDLVPEAWVGPEGRQAEAHRIGEYIAVSVVSVWTKMIRQRLAERKLS
jgi:hypothetical protein